jgi:AcrR family transcriptional regulator
VCKSSNVCFERSFQSAGVSPISSLIPSPDWRQGLAPARGRDTKSRLLDATERLFVANGFEGTSLRAVTREAGASLSAANYHFGSKEAMISAAVLRRIEPLNQRRLDALAALEAAADRGAPAVEAIVEAFLRPGFEEIQAHPRSGDSFYAKLAARLHSDPSAAVASLGHTLFEPVATRFLESLARALPRQTHADRLMGFHFLVGMLVHTLIAKSQPHPLDMPESPAVAPEARLARMVGFAAAGLRAAEEATSTEAST